jgi:hypothetical protein
MHRVLEDGAKPAMNLHAAPSALEDRFGSETSLLKAKCAQ